MPPPKKKLPTGPARSDSVPPGNWRSQLKQAATEPFRLPEEQDPDASHLSSPSPEITPEIQPEITPSVDPDDYGSGGGTGTGFSRAPSSEGSFDQQQIENLKVSESDSHNASTPTSDLMPAPPEDLAQVGEVSQPVSEAAIGIPFPVDPDQPQTLLGLSAEALALLDPLEQQTQLPANLLLEAMLTTWPTWPEDMQQRILRQSHSLKVERLLKAQTEALATLERLLQGSPDWPVNPSDPNSGSQ